MPSTTTKSTKSAPKPAARTTPTQRVLDALTDHGPLVNGEPWDKRLDAEQRERALTAPAGLSGKAASTFVLTGQRAGEQIAAAKAEHGERQPVAGDTAAKAAPAANREVKAPREGSAIHAAITVLKGAKEPMTPQDIYDRAVKRGLAGGLKGKTPVATLAAQLAVANKKGLHVERPEPGKYRLRQG